MRKSLIKFILSNTKNDFSFEDRMVQVFQHNLAGEVALDTLVLGYPTAIISYNEPALANKMSRDGMKVVNITKVELRESTEVSIEYTALYTRWFKDQESADDAVAKGCRYDGYSYKKEDYTISASIQANDSTRYSLEELEDEGLVVVERD